MANGAVLREILVRLGVDTQAPMTKKQLEEFEQGLERVQKTMRSGVTMAVQYGTALAALAAGAAAALGGLTVEMGGQAAEIEKQARLLNMSTDEYQQWAYVAERSNASIMDLADTMLQINDITSRALGGSKEAADTFALIGVNVKSLQGLNPGQVFEVLADAVSGATDKGKALSAVSQILGEEAARQFGPSMVQGAQATRALREEAVKLGVVMSGRQLSTLTRISVQWQRLRTLLKGLKKDLTSALAPAVERILKGLSDWLEANRKLLAQRIEAWVTRAIRLFESLDRAVQAVGGWDVVLLNVATGAGMLLLLANLDKVKDLLFGLRLAWAAAGVAASAAAAATGIAVLPLTLIILGVVTAVGLLALGLEDLWVWLQGGNSLLDRNLDLVESMIPAFGGLRELVWALAQAFASAFTKVGLFKDAILDGLAPALRLLDVLVQPLLEAFRELGEWWAYGNAVAGSWLSGAASQVRGVTLASDASASGLASLVRGQLAGAVQNQVDRAISTINNVDNSSTSGTINQTNNFGGGAAVRDVSAALESAARRALPIVQGGRR